MKKWKLLLASVAMGLLCQKAVADEKTLYILSYAGVFDNAVLEDFTKQTGYQVQVDAADSGEVMDTKMLTGHSGFDLVTPAAIPFLEREIKAKAVRQLDLSKIPNYKNMDSDLVERLLKISDPTLDHATIGAWGSTGLGLNEEKVKAVAPGAPLDSLDLVFKPENAQKLSKCGLVFLDSPTDVFPLVFQYLKLDVNNVTKKDIDKAMAVLEKIRPYITYIDASKYGTELSNGAICAAIAWSSDVVMANQSAAEAKNGISVSYVVPKEGALGWITTFAVPSDAKNVDAAYAFMNYMLDKQVAATMTKNTGLPSPVPSASALLPAEMAANEIMFPKAETKQRLFTGRSPSEDVLRYMNRQWSKFKAAS